MSGKLTMLAEERRTNGCIKPCCEAFKDAREPSSTLQSTGYIGVLWTMENFDYLPWNFSLRRPLDVVLILPPLPKLGIDLLLTYASLCWRTRRLSLLSPPLLYAHAER